MGIIKTGIQAGVAYAAVNKVANSLEANAKAKAGNKVPPHAPCNCPHCPFSAQAVYGNAHGSRDAAAAAAYAYGASPYAPAPGANANASYYAAQAGAPVPRDSDHVLERGGAAGDDKKGYYE
ncbi:uncharacterized protein LOC62_05G007608 [Vanrija pseudolonga]|uniref:Uncharacterized protein n=1 Tax=Vanrija pseudolonga TaxID=143232 RepID=A0AAF0YCB4_9TREE|nr:hypothetical protein LOC62_05G007608 [Vanrija pseudolonga]